MTMLLFWVVKPCRLVDRYLRHNPEEQHRHSTHTFSERNIFNFVLSSKRRLTSPLLNPGVTILDCINFHMMQAKMHLKACVHLIRDLRSVVLE
jgi:hypothetical protein